MPNRGSLAHDVARYEGDPEFVAESVALEVLECALDIMQRNEITKADLARTMGISRSAVSQLFGRGAHNLTLLTIARLASALGAEFTCRLSDGVLRERPPRPFEAPSDDGLEQFAALAWDRATYADTEEASDLPSAA
jgi:transcriptional regulator with XRE-family HTH domain